MPGTKPRGGPIWRSRFLDWHRSARENGRIELEVSYRRKGRLTAAELDRLAAEFRRLLTREERNCVEADRRRNGQAVYEAWRKIPAWQHASATDLREALRKAGKSVPDHEIRRVLTFIGKAIADLPRQRKALASLPIDEKSRKRLVALTEAALKPGLERLR
jgi:hypothetical protein